MSARASCKRRGLCVLYSVVGCVWAVPLDREPSPSVQSWKNWLLSRVWYPYKTPDVFARVSCKKRGPWAVHAVLSSGLRVERCRFIADLPPVCTVMVAPKPAPLVVVACIHELCTHGLCMLYSGVACVVSGRLTVDPTPQFMLPLLPVSYGTVTNA